MVWLEYIHLLQVLSSLKLKPPVYLKGFIIIIIIVLENNMLCDKCADELCKMCLK